jgi:cell division protein FtsX
VVRVGSRWPWALVVLAVVVAGCSTESPAPNRFVDMIGPADAEVVLAERASNLDVAPIRDRLRRSPWVREFAFVDREESLRETRRIFPDDAADLTAPGVASVPELFRVLLEDPSAGEPFRQGFERMPGVDFVRVGRGHTQDVRHFDIDERFQSCGRSGEVEIFLDDGADDAAKQRVWKNIRELPGIRHARFVSHAAAGRLFRCAFRVSDVRGDELPESFLLDLSPTADVDRIAALESVRGVDDVWIRDAPVPAVPAV